MPLRADGAHGRSPVGRFAVTGWSAALLPALVSAAVVLLPGLAVAFSLRMRGMLLWGFAPAAGVAALAVSATVLGWTGLRWSVWTAAGAVTVLVVCTVLIGLLLSPLRAGGVPRSRLAGSTFALVAGSLFGAFRMAVMIGAPQNISQTNDATFHLNALRFVLESGSASSFDLLGAIGASGFYPAAWHAIASLVMDISGADVVRAANATSLVIAGPIWTLSITSFVWCVTNGARWATVGAALMASALFAFPFNMLDFGVLYPYALSLAIVPGTLAVLVAALRQGTRSDDRRARPRRIWSAAIASLVGLTAMGFAQPSALLTWVIGAVVIGASALLGGWHEPAARRGLRIFGTLCLGAGGMAAWLAITALSSSVLWAPQKSALPAAVDLLLNASTGPGPVVVVSALAVAGTIVSVQRAELRWMVAFGTAISLLTLVAVSVQNESIRALLSAWYADPHRFTAMMPLVVVPLAAIGLDAAASWFRVRGWSAAVAIVLLVAVVVEASVWTAVGVRSGHSSYAESDRSYLSEDERDLLEVLPRYVAPGERVLGNPSAGAAFGYALSGVDVVPRTWSMPLDVDFQVLREDLVRLIDEPAVCTAVDDLGIDYVLDFGASAKGPGKWAMPGLTGFAHAEGFQKVAEDGEASLWRVTGC